MSEKDLPTRPEVATGDRREEVRYEPDPAQLVRMRATFPVDGPLAPEDASPTTEAALAAPAGPPIQDVAVAKDAPSVWDARPADDSLDQESGRGH